MRLIKLISIIIIAISSIGCSTNRVVSYGADINDSTFIYIQHYLGKFDQKNDTGILCEQVGNNILGYRYMYWIKNASRKLDFVVCASFIVLTVMVLLSGFVYSVWIGEEVQIPLRLSAVMAAYIFVLIVSLRYSYILNGVNALRIQLIFTILATIAFIPLSWYAGKMFQDVTGIVLVMCLINVPGMLANAWKYYQIFYKDKTHDIV